MRTLICLILLVATPAGAGQPQTLDALHDRIAADLKAGQPLIIAAYYGLWFTRNDDPERNLNWGTYYGHMRMMRRVQRDRHVRKNYRYAKWREVLAESQGEDPLRTLVFAQTVRPNRRWRRAGVTEPFQVYLVMQAFQSREEAARRMARNLRQDAGRALTLADGTTLDVGAAQATGYFGHNLFYDHAGFRWDGFDRVVGTPERPKGVFAVACKTGRVPGFNDLIGENVRVLLYSRTLMAAEGYSTLSLAEGLIGRMTSKEFVRHANATYAYFQKLGKPERRVGRPFVSHGYKLFE